MHMNIDIFMSNCEIIFQKNDSGAVRNLFAISFINVLQTTSITDSNPGFVLIKPR